MTQTAVIGAGYVGLTTAACLAHLGHDVICADIDAEKVERLSKGDVPILEPGLDELVREGLDGNRLSFVVGAGGAVPEVDFVFLCLPTPLGAGGSADLSYLHKALSEVAPVLRTRSILINKSTAPVGTIRMIEATIERNDVHVVSNPEFLREGSAIYDSLHPARLVLGSDHQEAAAKVAELFRVLNAPVVITDPASAETIKYASNAFLAAKLSFINGIARLCEGTGADIKDVSLGMGYDSRIGFEFLTPGPGWGGSCFPKDVYALLSTAEDAGYDFGLLRAVIDANRDHYDWMANKIRLAAGGTLKNKTVGVWGLSFKADTDDLRNSASLFIIDLLKAQGATVKAYDISQTRGGRPRHSSLDGVEICSDAYGAAESADVLAVLTEWEEFRRLDFEKVRNAMNTPTVVDGRNLLDASALRRCGFTYTGVGRP